MVKRRLRSPRLPKPSTPIDPAKMIPVGSVVQWYSNGNRFGVLKTINRKWAVVLYNGKKKRILLDEVKLYEY